MSYCNNTIDKYLNEFIWDAVEIENSMDLVLIDWKKAPKKFW